MEFHSRSLSLQCTIQPHRMSQKASRTKFQIQSSSLTHPHLLVHHQLISNTYFYYVVVVVVLTALFISYFFPQYFLLIQPVRYIYGTWWMVVGLNGRNCVKNRIKAIKKDIFTLWIQMSVYIFLLIVRIECRTKYFYCCLLMVDREVKSQYTYLLNSSLVHL